MKNKNLKIARVEKEMSQEDLAMMAGCTRQTIVCIEAGTYNPTLNLCISICRALGKTLDELFWNDNAELPKTSWIVIEVEPGAEAKVKKGIEKEIAERNFEHLILAVEIPEKREGERFTDRVVVKWVPTVEGWNAIKDVEGIKLPYRVLGKSKYYRKG